MQRKQYFFGAALLILLAALYGYFVEPFAIRVERVVIPDEELHRSWGDVRIAQLSDLHIDRIGRREEKILRLLAAIRPDLIVVTGDMAQWNKDPRVALQFVEGLRAPLGVYAILGDADISSGRRYCIFCHAGDDVHRLRQQPRMLRNGMAEITVPTTGKKVAIAGVFPTNDIDPSALFEQLRQTAEPVLFLDHVADGWPQLSSKGPLLWLAGDTHGGQIGMPAMLWRRLPLLDHPRYMAGLFSADGHKWLYVNRGLGTVAYFPFRLGVPPEITVISFQDR